MSPWIVAAIVAVFVVPPAVLGYALCKAAREADEAMERAWRDYGPVPCPDHEDEG